MAQWLEWVPWEHGELSLYAQHEQPGAEVCISSPITVGSDSRIPGAHWQARLANLRTALQSVRDLVSENIVYWNRTPSICF